MKQWSVLNIFLWASVGLLIGVCHAQPPKLDGAFFWVGGGNASWSQNRWEQELAWMRQIQMDTIIVTASVNETVAIYPTGITGFTQTGSDPIEKILSEADENSMDVYLGLLLTSQWWSDTSEAFLDSLTERSKAIASDLYPRYSSHPSLKGFYITQEVDNLNWVQEPIRQRLVQRFLKPVSDHIKNLDSSLIVCEAPFFNTACQKAPEYRTWWMQTLAETPNLDLIIPQDGIGVHHAGLSDVVEYFTALKDACDANDRELWSDLEVFEQMGGGLVPASIERIAAQLATEAPLVERFVCWEFLSYLSPAHSSASLDLFLDYLNYLNGNAPWGNIALNKNYSLSNPPDSSYPDSGGQLTDGLAASVPAAQVGWAEPATIAVTVDLEGTNESIHGFRSSIYHSTGANAVLPSSISVSLSDNGEDFNPAGVMQWLVGENASVNTYYLLLLEPAGGRYVRYDLTRGNGLLLCSELGVYSARYEEPALPDLLSHGKPYTISIPPSATYPDSGGELTDDDTSYSWPSQLGWQNPGTNVVVTVDLQDQYSIRRVEAYFMRAEGSGVHLPKEVTVRVSSDGEDFTEFAKAGPESLADNSINRYAARGSVRARFAQLAIVPEPGWLMLCEVKILGLVNGALSGWSVR